MYVSTCLHLYLHEQPHVMSKKTAPFWGALSRAAPGPLSFPARQSKGNILTQRPRRWPPPGQISPGSSGLPKVRAGPTFWKHLWLKKQPHPSSKVARKWMLIHTWVHVNYPRSARNISWLSVLCRCLSKIQDIPNCGSSSDVHCTPRPSEYLKQMLTVLKLWAWYADFTN